MKTIHEMVGRVYTVRRIASKYKLYETPYGGAKINRLLEGTLQRVEQTFHLTYKDLGSACLVIEQRSKRIKILTACGRTGWIPYYYLIGEVTNLYNKKSRGIQQAISLLAEVNADGADQMTIEKISDVIFLLKAIQLNNL